MKILLMILACLLSSSTVFAMELFKPREHTLIISGHPDYPPYSWYYNRPACDDSLPPVTAKSQGTLCGASVELVSILAQRLNLRYEIKFAGDWESVQLATHKGQVDMIMAAYKNNTRTRYMTYTDYYTWDPVAVFVLSSNAKNFTFNNWSDLEGKKGSTHKGESYGTQFDAFMQRYLDVRLVDVAYMNYDLLKSKQTDYYINGKYTGLAEADLKGFGDLVTTKDTIITQETFHLTISRHTRHITKTNELIKAMNEELAYIRHSKLFDKLRADNLIRYSKMCKKSEDCDYSRH